MSPEAEVRESGRWESGWSAKGEGPSVESTTRGGHAPVVKPRKNKSLQEKHSRGARPSSAEDRMCAAEYYSESYNQSSEKNKDLCLKSHEYHSGV